MTPIAFKVGMPALAVQVLTGVWLAHRFLADAPGGWFGAGGPARVSQLKLAFLGATAVLALHAKLRVIPRLRHDNLAMLGSHIVAVSVLGVGFVLAGISLRLGGYPIIQP